MTPIPKTDIDVYPLNLGGNTFGWTSDRDESFEVLHLYEEVGGNFVDTADMYSSWKPGNSGGESEIILGEWIATRQNRSRMVIATKVGKHPQFRGLDPHNIVRAVEASLVRLQTDYIDLYYAHSDDPEQSIFDVAVAFDSLVKDGKIRCIGASNFGPERLKEWIDVAAAEGLAGPVAIQPNYSLVTRADYEHNLLPLVDNYDLAVFSYYSLAGGFLTGKYRDPAEVAGAVRENTAGKYVTAEGFELLRVLDEVAAQHSCSVATVSLAWLLARGVTAPIASARTARQLPDLVNATTIDLDDDQMARLDTASAPFL